MGGDGEDGREEKEKRKKKNMKKEVGSGGRWGWGRRGEMGGF